MRGHLPGEVHQFGPWFPSPERPTRCKRRCEVCGFIQERPKEEAIDDPIASPVAEPGPLDAVGADGLFRFEPARVIRRKKLNPSFKKKLKNWVEPDGLKKGPKR